MGRVLKCISPIDGSVLAERRVLSCDAAREVVGRAFGFVNFTGSVWGAQAMEHVAAGTFNGVATELGGKDPGDVIEGADLDAAVDTLNDGTMINAGQSCCGGLSVIGFHNLTLPKSSHLKKVTT